MTYECVCVCVQNSYSKRKALSTKMLAWPNKALVVPHCFYLNYVQNKLHLAEYKTSDKR